MRVVTQDIVDAARGGDWLLAHELARRSVVESSIVLNLATGATTGDDQLAHDVIKCAGLCPLNLVGTLQCNHTITDTQESSTQGDKEALPERSTTDSHDEGSPKSGKQMSKKSVEILHKFVARMTENRTRRTHTATLVRLSKELLLAAGAGHLEEVKRLIKQGAYVNYKCPSHSLYQAATGEHQDVVFELLKSGAQPSFKVEGLDFMSWCISKGYLQCVRYFLRLEGVDAETRRYHHEQFWETTILTAVRSKQFECLEMLLKEPGINEVINKPARDGKTPLFIAASLGLDQFVKKLIDCGALLNLSDSSNETALFIAAEHGHVGCLELLIAAGADVNLANWRRTTPHIVATEKGHLKCSNLLKAANADVNKSIQSASRHQIPKSAESEALSDWAKKLRENGPAQQSTRDGIVSESSDNTGHNPTELSCEQNDQGCKSSAQI